MWKPDLFEYDITCVNYTQDCFVIAECNSIVFMNMCKVASTPVIVDVYINGAILLPGSTVNALGQFAQAYKYEVRGNFGEHDKTQYQIKFLGRDGGPPQSQAVLSCLVIRKTYKNRQAVIDYLAGTANR
jgi:hypothetical protein